MKDMAFAFFLSHYRNGWRLLLVLYQALEFSSSSSASLVPAQGLEGT
jgi:hypothetical protein